jgi:hypothetical protein
MIEFTDIEKRKLINSKDFVNAWFRMLPHYKTYEDAYEALEVIYVGYYFKRRYSHYESFRQIRVRLQRTS